LQQDFTFKKEGKSYFINSETTSLEKIAQLHSFKYHHQIYFENQEMVGEVVTQIQKERIDKQAIDLGCKFQNQILSGFVVSVNVQHISLEVGYGLFAMRDLKVGDFIGEYVGEIKHRDYFNSSDYLYRYPIQDCNGIPYCIDGQHGNLLRFANHSKRGNIRAYVAYITPFYHQIFLAIQPIKIGDQLVYDYGNNYWYSRGKPIIF